MVLAVVGRTGNRGLGLCEERKGVRKELELLVTVNGVEYKT